MSDDELARQLDAGLRAVSGARTRAVPMIELAGYAEDAASNLLDVLKHPTSADAANVTLDDLIHRRPGAGNGDALR